MAVHTEDLRNCNKCKKGFYMTKPCTKDSREPTCEPCQQGSYTDTDNHLDHCRVCTKCLDDQQLRTRSRCSREMNAECECKEGSYCTNEHEISCSHCVARTTCPPGEGATNPGSRSDTKCEPCSQGTFSNDTTILPCRPHTKCEGRDILQPGSAVADAVCGNPICDSPYHHWIIPASLWAGFIVSVLIVGLAFIYWKRRRQSRLHLRTTETPDGGHVEATAAPDILPPPPSLDKGACVESHPFNTCTVETNLLSNSCNCSLESDGPASPIVTSPTSPTVTSPTSPMRLLPSTVGTCAQGQDSIGPSVCPSEPQEDEWNGI